MAFIVMIQDEEKSPMFSPLCEISQDSLSIPYVIETITEAYRQTIPGHIVENVTLTTSHLSLNNYKIVVVQHLDRVDDEGHDYVDYFTFELLVNVKYVPTFGRKDIQ